MKPHSRVIQLVPQMNDNGTIIHFLALCEDGSIWLFEPAAEKTFKLLEEMNGVKYI